MKSTLYSLSSKYVCGFVANATNLLVGPLVYSHKGPIKTQHRMLHTGSLGNKNSWVTAAFNVFSFRGLEINFRNKILGKYGVYGGREWRDF